MYMESLEHKLGHLKKNSKNKNNSNYGKQYGNQAKVRLLSSRSSEHKATQRVRAQISKEEMLAHLLLESQNSEETLGEFDKQTQKKRELPICC